MNNQDLTLRPATGQLALLRSNQLSAQELAEAHITRITRLNPTLNALVDFDPDRVRTQAQALDASPSPRGPLHGLPVTIKASIAVAGHLCELGSLLHQGHRPAADALLVQRLRCAGAVIVGTTNCPEFLMAYHSENRLHGRTSNPWALDRTPGGSSGGESAAIASGMSAAGLGSDSGGSVRVPAHFTGICALKPTPGRLPATGHLPPCTGPFATLGAIGPMARTIADVDLLFRTLAGPSDTDPAAAPVPLRHWSDDDLRATPVGLIEEESITADTRAALHSAAEALRSRGFRVDRLTSAPFFALLERARELWWMFFVRAGAMLFLPGTVGHEPRLSDGFREFLDIAAGAGPYRRPAGPLGGDELLQAWVEADAVRAALLREMHAYPVLLTPVCAVPAFRHGERAWTVEDATGAPATVHYLDAMRYTQWFNLLGAPAAVTPVSRSREGLPIGVQVAGRPYEDERVLGIAAIIDQAFGYIAPPLATAASLAATSPQSSGN